MTKFVRVVLLLLCAGGVIDAQERTAQHAGDTSTHVRMSLTDPERFFFRPTLLLPAFFGTDIPPHTGTAVSLRNALVVQPSLFSASSSDPIPVISSLRMKWEREDDLKLIRSLLGTVEACGAAYAAYRAVKKYGFR